MELSQSPGLRVEAWPVESPSRSTSSKRPYDYSADMSTDSGHKRRRTEPPSYHVVQELSNRYAIAPGIVTSVLETNEAEDAIQALGEFHESWLETTGRGRKRPREDAASAGGPMDPAVLNLGLDVDPTRLGGVTCQANKRLNRGGLGPSSASAEHPGITSTGMYPLEPLPQQAASASSSTSSSGLQLGHGNCSHLEDGTWAVPQTPEGWAQEFLTAVEQCGGSLPSPATQAEFQQRVLKLLHKYGDHHVVGVVGGGGQGGAQQGGLLSKYERLRNANQVLYRAISQMNDRMRRQQAELKTDLDHTAVRQKKYHELEEKCKKLEQQNDILRYHLQLKG